MDLAGLSSLSIYNDKYKFLLNFIDTFSRYAWSIPLKDKTGKSIAAVLTITIQSKVLNFSILLSTSN